MAKRQKSIKQLTELEQFYMKIVPRVTGPFRQGDIVAVDRRQAERWYKFKIAVQTEDEPTITLEQALARRSGRVIENVHLTPNVVLEQDAPGLQEVQLDGLETEDLKLMAEGLAIEGAAELTKAKLLSAIRQKKKELAEAKAAEG